jgi:hypothetical protein
MTIAKNLSYTHTYTPMNEKQYEIDIKFRIVHFLSHLVPIKIEGTGKNLIFKRIYCLTLPLIINMF